MSPGSAVAQRFLQKIHAQLLRFSESNACSKHVKKGFIGASAPDAIRTALQGLHLQELQPDECAFDTATWF